MRDIVPLFIHCIMRVVKKGMEIYEFSIRKIILGVRHVSKMREVKKRMEINEFSIRKIGCETFSM